MKGLCSSRRLWLIDVDPARGKMKHIHIGGFLQRRMYYSDLLVSPPATTSPNLNNFSCSKKSLLNKLIGGMQEHWYETKIHKYLCPVVSTAITRIQKTNHIHNNCSTFSFGSPSLLAATLHLGAPHMSPYLEGFFTSWGETRIKHKPKTKIDNLSCLKKIIRWCTCQKQILHATLLNVQPRVCKIIYYIKTINSQ